MNKQFERRYVVGNEDRKEYMRHYMKEYRRLNPGKTNKILYEHYKRKLDAERIEEDKENNVEEIKKDG